MRALSINKLEKPLTPPPSNHPFSESYFPSVAILHVPRVSKVFLNHGLSVLDAPELVVAAVKSDP